MKKPATCSAVSHSVPNSGFNRGSLIEFSCACKKFEPVVVKSGDTRKVAAARRSLKSHVGTAATIQSLRAAAVEA